MINTIKLLLIMTDKNLILDSVRLIPRDAEFLERKTGNRGEIFYDKQANTLRLYNGQSVGGISLAKNDLTNVSNSDFLAKANSAGFSGGVQTGVAGKIAYYPSNGSQVNDLTALTWLDDSTNTLILSGVIDITGQKNRIRFHWDTLADLNDEVSPVDYHGMVAHVHDTGKLYYAHAGAWVPVASESSLPNSFSIVAVAGQSSVIADSTADTLTLAAGSNITITTNAGTDTITINSTTSTGSITFVGTTIDSADSSTITFTPTVAFDSDVVVGNEIVFADGSRQATSAVGIPGPQGEQGPQGASGAGTGDVLSAGGGYVDNAIIRYDGTTGTIIQNSSATISDAGLLTATNFSGGGANITALNASNLGSGTVPDARFPATLPATSGVNLTSLNASNLGSGTVPDARFPETLPAASGVNLTALNATELTSGTVPVLRLGASGTRDATTYLRGDNTWATVSGGGGAASDSFATISVAGQSSVVADSATDTLTLVAGTGITITTDVGTDTITITNSSSASNSFSTVAVTGQSNVEADSATDTLTLAAGTGISITTDAGTDTVTITSTVAAGATAFTGLSDAGSLTVDRFYLPAITMLDVTANGATAYRFDQYGTTDDPTIYAINATTIAFNLAGASGHPFLIQDNTGNNYNTGLVHVSTTGVVSTGAAAQAQQSGTLYWKIPDSISGNYRYQCQSHASMIGTITIKNFGSI
jgi:plastocyanin